MNRNVLFAVLLTLGACSSAPQPVATAEPACKLSLDADRHAAESAGYVFGKQPISAASLRKTLELFNAEPGEKLDAAGVSDGYVAMAQDSVVIVLFKDGCAVAHLEVDPEAVKQIFGTRT